METLDGTVLPFNRFGWYFRPATNMFEFWWMGDQPTMFVSNDVIPAMPMWIAEEITMAVAWKGDKGVLD